MVVVTPDIVGKPEAPQPKAEPKKSTKKGGK